MRIFLDLCVPRRLCRHLIGHDCVHASRVPWGEAKNGALIRSATEAGFDAMVTVDANMPFQTRLATDSLPVILLVAYTNRMEHIQPSVPRLLDALPRAVRGTYTILPFIEERPAE